MAFDKGQDNISAGGWEYHSIRVEVYKEKWEFVEDSIHSNGILSFYIYVYASTRIN